jgi:hypothetical protein
MQNHRMPFFTPARPHSQLIIAVVTKLAAACDLFVTNDITFGM